MWIYQFGCALALLAYPFIHNQANENYAGLGCFNIQTQIGRNIGDDGGMKVVTLPIAGAAE